MSKKHETITNETERILNQCEMEDVDIQIAETKRIVEESEISRIKEVERDYVIGVTVFIAGVVFFIVFMIYFFFLCGNTLGLDTGKVIRS